MLPNITLPHPSTVVPLAHAIPALRLVTPPAPSLPPNPFAELASPPPFLAPSTPGPMLAPTIPQTTQSVPQSVDDYDADKTEGDLTGEYIALRDAKKEAEAKHKEEVEARYDRRMDEIEKKMLARLTNAGAKSIKTTQGTAFKKRNTKYSVADDSFWAWVDANHQQDMLVKGIRQTAVADYVEAMEAKAKETGDTTLVIVPPGVSVFSETVVQFRK